MPQIPLTSKVGELCPFGDGGKLIYYYGIVNRVYYVECDTNPLDHFRRARGEEITAARDATTIRFINPADPQPGDPCPCQDNGFLFLWLDNKFNFRLICTMFPESHQYPAKDEDVEAYFRFQPDSPHIKPEC